MAKINSNYEAVYILNPDLNEEQIAALVERFKSVVEANGKLSVFPEADKRGPTTGELGIQTDYEGLPLPLIMDGRVQGNNLKQVGEDEEWLTALLKRRGLRAQDVYLACLDTQGSLYLQTEAGERMRLRALDPGKVGW